MDAEELSINNAVTMAIGGTATLGRIDQYELVRELGGGGFGTVYLAKDTVSGVDVAVKGLPPFVKNNREEMGNIRANFALVSRLTHTNIAKALVLHPAQSIAYASEDVRQKLRVLSGDMLMVMEYAPGVTLSQWRKQFPGRKVPIDKTIEITRQIATALDYAHERRIIHRDIKPANVMIETSANGSVTARVLDFGLAAEIRSSMGRVSQEIHDTAGTRPYMAPEQWLGDKQGSGTDQYALAVLFHELVTGDVPFASVFDTGDPVVMMNVVGNRQFTPPSKLPKPIRRALSRALAKKPEDRFASCGDFVAALGGRGFSRKERKERKGGRLLFVAALLAALAGGGYFVWMKYDAQVKAREAEEARIAAEKAAEEERKAAEKRALEEAARKAEEARIAAEKAAEEKRKAADEQKAKEEARLKAEAERKAREEDEARRAAAERVRKAKEEEAARIAAAKKAEEEREAAKQRELARQKEEEARKAREEKERQERELEIKRRVEEELARQKAAKEEEQARAKRQAQKASLSAAEQKLLGKWVCDMVVQESSGFVAKTTDAFLRGKLPVSSRLMLRCNEDGTVDMHDVSGRTVGSSAGTWRYRHGLLIMQLTTANGQKYQLSGSVNWSGQDGFELRFDNTEYANMIKLGCSDVAALQFVTSIYAEGKMEITIMSQEGSVLSAKSAKVLCEPFIFRRQ